MIDEKAFYQACEDCGIGHLDFARHRNFLAAYHGFVSSNDSENMEQADIQHILGYELRLTCGGCPEQYDVFKDGDQVAYLRLRHGGFRCDVPNCGGETIYTADPKGDGEFESGERRRYLTEAIRAVIEHASRDRATNE